ncbi:hypothetical protein NKH77_49330 [Streptomyces sp. M19]
MTPSWSPPAAHLEGLLRRRLRLGHISEFLSWHEYHPARLVIHRDPVYMAADEKYWSVQNAAVDGQNCETSISIGKIYGAADPDGVEPNIYKSWAAHRSFDPPEILAERKFMHPLSTPRTLGPSATWRPIRGPESVLRGKFHHDH